MSSFPSQPAESVAKSVVEPAAASVAEAGAPKAEILSLEKAERMAEFFGGLGDPNRWRILSALALGEQRVGELAAAVAMSESAVSHQLRTLRSLRLVSRQKQGRTVVYRLTDHHIFDLYRAASEHLDEPGE